VNRPEVTEGHCDTCCEFGPILDDLCRACHAEINPGPLSPWMVAVLFDLDAARAPNAWSDYLDAMAGRRAPGGEVTAWNLRGPLWARVLLDSLEAVS
jgi:hypothetical protein